MLSTDASDVPGRFRNPGAIGLFWLVVAALWTGAATPAAAQARAAGQPSFAAIIASATPGEPADLVYQNRTITTLRATVLSRQPAERASAAARVLDNLVGAGQVGPIATRPVDGAMVISVGARDVFAILPLDVNELAGESVEAAAATAAGRLQLALMEATELRTPGRLLRAAATALAATLLAAGLLWVLIRLHRVLSTRLQQSAERRLALLAAGDSQLVRLSRAADLFRHIVTFASAVAAVLVAYSWLTFVLRRFPYTRPWGESMRGFMLERISALVLMFVGTLPNLFTALLIFLAIRFAVRLLHTLFAAVESGQLSLPYVYPETAQTTRRLVSTLLWLLGLVAAYPYLPGSGSDAFKGISVFVGLVISLGSSGIVNQMMSGLTLTYSRALRLGEFVRIGDVDGTVTHLGALSTKIKTLRGEEVTLPNTLVMSYVTTNYSRFASEGVYVPTTITIGYDTPWRQVRALLLLAAERTPGVRREPAPTVIQTALQDFYVVYTLLVCLEHPQARARVLDALHASIQDAFNEFGVQIMSPNYEADPEARKVVPPDQWYSAPARPAAEITQTTVP
jgi:small-conductance mechanosensitive channel